MKIAVGFLAIILAFPAHAKMCKTMTMDGKEVFMWAADDDGTLMKTKYASGLVATMDLCPEQPVEIVRKEIIEEYVTPNPQTKCERLRYCHVTQHGAAYQYARLAICKTSVDSALLAPMMLMGIIQSLVT